VLGEPDAEHVVRELDRFEMLVSSRLLRVELRRMAARESLLDVADRLLRTVALVAVDDAVLTAAEMLRRLALRHGALDAAQELLQGIALAPLEQATLGIAETIEPRGIATLDAIHLATAVRMSETSTP